VLSAIAVQKPTATAAAYETRRVLAIVFSSWLIPPLRHTEDLRQTIAMVIARDHRCRPIPAVVALLQTSHTCTPAIRSTTSMVTVLYSVGVRRSVWRWWRCLYVHDPPVGVNNNTSVDCCYDDGKIKQSN